MMSDGTFRSSWQEKIHNYDASHPHMSAAAAAAELGRGGPPAPYVAPAQGLPGGWTGSSSPRTVAKHSKAWRYGDQAGYVDVNKVDQMPTYQVPSNGSATYSNGSWSDGRKYSNGSNGSATYSNGSWSNGSNGDVKTGALSPRRTALASNIGYNPSGYQASGDVQDLLFYICKKEVNPENETTAGREAFAQKIRSADYESGHAKIVYLKPTMGQWQEIAKLLSGRENLMVLKRPIQSGAGQFAMDNEFYVINGQREFAPQILIDIIEGKIGTVNPKKIGYLENKTIYVPVKVAHQTSTMYRSPLSARMPTPGTLASPIPTQAGQTGVLYQGPLARPAGYMTPPASPYVVPGAQQAFNMPSYSSPTQLSSSGRTISAGMSPRRQSVYFPAAATVGSASSNIL